MSRFDDHFAFDADEIEFHYVKKHREGQHDQSTHGRKGGFNVPKYVDIEGKRFSAEAANEFAKRLVAYEQGQIDKLPESELKILKDNLDNHYLMKDAMNQLAWNEDGTLGPKTIGEIEGRHGESYQDFTTRMLRSGDRESFYADKADYSKPTNVLRRDENGNFLRDEDNGRVPTESVLVSKEVAERIHAEEWQAFGEAAYPEVIVSNKALRSILADGKFKTYTEANRPARAGANDDQYKNARAVYESVAFGYDNTQDVANRPVSGLLTAFDPHQDLLKGYGNTQVILKKSVYPRTTVTMSDSLNGFYRPQTVASFFSSPTPYRNKTVASDVQVNGKGYYTNRNRGIYNTPEIQIHGGVTVSDIDRVIFRDSAPAQLSNKLDSLGIPYEVRTIGEADE